MIVAFNGPAIDVRGFIQSRVNRLANLARRAGERFCGAAALSVAMVLPAVSAGWGVRCVAHLFVEVASLATIVSLGIDSNRTFPCFRVGRVRR